MALPQSNQSFEEHDPSETAIIAIRTCISSQLAKNAITLINP